jgi:hypothetical protein
MNDLQKEMAILKFEKTGSLILNSQTKKPRFNLSPPSTAAHGHVYMWVAEIDNKPARILYIGKAGETVLKRCRNHENGFRGGHPTGIKHCQKLLPILRGRKYTIGLYSRVSKRAKIFDQKNVPLCEAEEYALILKYQSRFRLFNQKIFISNHTS